uniref:Uncharacterized protein n=1 Tax=Pelagomonas calceolata TaxID=35677 RepID=A0A7S3ZLX7_9STRA
MNRMNRSHSPGLFISWRTNNPTGFPSTKRAETFAVEISPSSSSIVIAVIAPCGTSSSRSQLKNDGLSKLNVATPFSPSLDLRGDGVSRWRVRCVDTASPPRQLDVRHVRLIQALVETDAGARFD